MNELTNLPEPWLYLWPAEDLEPVNKCPACEASDRKILFADVVDNVYRVASGKWTFYECQKCRSAYINPRPTQSSIGRAYQAYCTHNAALMSEAAENLKGFRRLRRSLANGYTNERYGTHYSPENKAGRVFSTIFFLQRELLDTRYRWLPKPEAGWRLLDVGCGNGGFLSAARDAGWKVTGLDPDPAAVKAARNFGLDVHVGLIDHFSGEKELFNAVTLSHVIEHIHEPKAALATVFRLLKPGGILYLDTPNIQARGLSIFGRNWRGFEAPRHLVVFSPTGLTQLLRCCGFKNIDFRRRIYPIKWMFLNSYKLQLGVSPNAEVPKGLPARLSFKAYVPPISHMGLEFITLTAKKAFF